MCDTHGPLSIRDCFYRYLTVSNPDLLERILRAEDIQDWLHDGTYRDLITFEQHLAGLASLAILFVESPGSIAELGSFVLVPAISEKLLVFISRDHYEDPTPSFIQLGPIRYMEDRCADQVFVYPWTTDLDQEAQINSPGRIETATVDPYLQDMVDDVLNRLRENPSTQQFQIDTPGHRMLLIADLSDLFLAVRAVEIKSYFELIGIKASTADIERYLFILQKLELLTHVPYGGERFFVSAGNGKHIKYGLKDESGLVRSRVQAEVSDFCSKAKHEPHDVKRMRMLKSRAKPASSGAR